MNKKWLKLFIISGVMVITAGLGYFGVTMIWPGGDGLKTGINEDIDPGRTDQLPQPKAETATSVQSVEEEKDSEESVKSDAGVLPISATTSRVIENEAEKPAQSKIILHDAPFTSQAPDGEWDDPRQQDGCEEAASLMAVRWARGENLDKAEAKREILAIAAYEEENYGNFHDTSATATVERIIKGYLKYEKAEVKFDAIKADIIDALYSGSVVIAPMDGQALQNPNYTAPGPERHMLLVIGYDPIKKEFITNDNGTRRGGGYRYKEDHFYASIRDYPSGYHTPITGVAKNIIIVSK